MLATVMKKWDNEDGSGQDYKVVLLRSSQSGNKLKASTWDEKMFPHLIEGANLDVSITMTKKGNKKYYNIAKITPVEDFEKASKEQTQSKEESSYGPTIGNSRTNAIEAVRMMVALDLFSSTKAKGKTITKDALLAEINFVTQNFFRDSLHLKAQAIAGAFKNEENTPGPTEENKEVEELEEETEDLSEVDEPEIEKDIPF